MATKPVVVGVDGSEESLRAVEWAALEARRHSSPLRIVSAPALVPRTHAYNAAPAAIANALRGISARALTSAVTRAEEVAQGLPITTGLLAGPPAVAVAESGSAASMLVVGARGAGGFAAMVQGSVSRYAASRAACPVVVVREESMAVHREIAVGIRDPQDTAEALAFAFEEAALRHADLVAVHTWYWFPAALHLPAAGAELRPTDPGRITAEAASSLAAALSAWQREVPGRAGPSRHRPRASRPGARELLRPRRPRGARQARSSRRRGSRHRLNPARGPRPRSRPGGRRSLRRKSS